jgi:phosphatidylserine decarboxylase
MPATREQAAASPGDRIRAWLFTLLPHHLVSRVVFWVTRLQGSFVKPMISAFVKIYRVDMQDAVIEDIGAYPSFNEFFVRALKPEARPVVEHPQALASPVDGTVSQCGPIAFDHLFQAKNQCYSMQDLLGGDRLLAKLFHGGRFATIYLAPYNYHRIHMPIDGKLKKMIHVPGRLFSVAPWTVRAVPRLFARNERVVCLFSTPCGPMAMVLVGAINVAAIETVWHGLVTPPKGRKITEFDYDHADKHYQRGEEMGRFNMGSTVILLTTEKVRWSSQLQPGQPLKMGEMIGAWRP